MGSPWRDVPQCYGPWQTVYGLFRRWQRAGVWLRIVTGLQTRADVVGLIGWDVSVDSTIARAHQHAAGARTAPERQKEPPGGVDDEPADHGLGRSRGGWTTKVHLACEQGRKPLAMLVTGGQRGDSPQFTRVLARIRVPRPDGGRPRTRPDRVLADKAYSSRGNRRRAAPARHPGHDPDQDRPGRQPTQEGVERRSATCLRPHRLPAASGRRVRHQPAQTPPSRSHQIRQTRCALPGHTPRRGDQRVALTRTIETRPRSSPSPVTGPEHTHMPRAGPLRRDREAGAAAEAARNADRRRRDRRPAARQERLSRLSVMTERRRVRIPRFSRRSSIPRLLCRRRASRSSSIRSWCGGNRPDGSGARSAPISTRARELPSSSVPSSSGSSPRTGPNRPRRSTVWRCASCGVEARPRRRLNAERTHPPGGHTRRGRRYRRARGGPHPGLSGSCVGVRRGGAPGRRVRPR
ncbi:Transposase DDE domain protein [Micromonospora sp. MW-13]|nr:Transposase DDE domain protein [Micromonospora sp. MW-13]